MCLFSVCILFRKVFFFVAFVAFVFVLTRNCCLYDFCVDVKFVLRFLIVCFFVFNVFCRFIFLVLIVVVVRRVVVVASVSRFASFVARVVVDCVFVLFCFRFIFMCFVLCLSIFNCCLNVFVVIDVFFVFFFVVALLLVNALFSSFLCVCFCCFVLFVFVCVVFLGVCSIFVVSLCIMCDVGDVFGVFMLLCV